MLLRNCFLWVLLFGLGSLPLQAARFLDTAVVEAKDSIAESESGPTALTLLRGEDSLRMSLVSYAKKYLNKPYCSAGKQGKCFDCSGLMYKVFGDHGIKLPPSSSTQAVCGNFIHPLNAKSGDLIFFNGRRKNEEVGHVGMIVEITDSEVYFIHSTIHAGVIISKLSEVYYKDRFMCVKNILSPEEPALETVEKINTKK
jgi:hypothetical protein